MDIRDFSPLGLTHVRPSAWGREDSRWGDFGRFGKNQLFSPVYQGCFRSVPMVLGGVLGCFKVVLGSLCSFLDWKHAGTAFLGAVPEHILG